MVATAFRRRLPSRMAQLRAQVRVAVHESGHHHAAAGADFHGIAGQREVLHTARRTDLLENSVAHQQRPIVNDGQLR